MRGKRGYTLAESVVALALLSVMAAGVFSIIIVSSKRRAEYAATLSATRVISNIVECFKCDDFSSALSFYTGDDVGLTYETNGEGNNKCAEVCVLVLYFDIEGNYSLKEAELKTEIKVEKDDNKESLEVVVSYGNDELGRRRYAKRAEADS